MISIKVVHSYALDTGIISATELCYRATAVPIYLSGTAIDVDCSRLSSSNKVMEHVLNVKEPRVLNIIK